MDHGRIGDLVTGATGAAAGTVVDPKQGIQRLRSALPLPLLVAVAVVVGYLLGRRPHL